MGTIGISFDVKQVQLLRNSSSIPAYIEDAKLRSFMSQEPVRRIWNAAIEENEHSFRSKLANLLNRARIVGHDEYSTFLRNDGRRTTEPDRGYDIRIEGLTSLESNIDSRIIYAAACRGDANEFATTLARLARNAKRIGSNDAVPD